MDALMSLKITIINHLNQNKMTAVEWLEQQLYKAGWEKLNNEEKWNICCTAKDMEREQIVKAYTDTLPFTHESIDNAERYYQRNYKMNEIN